jgi:methylmalonyl-CoA mutase
LNDGVIPLAEDFAPATDAAWRTLVDKTLDGRPFDTRLVRQTYDGVRIAPLYTAANAAKPLDGAAPSPHRDGHWDIRARVGHPDPVAANAAALEELEGGAASLLISVDPAGETGVAIGGRQDLERLLEGVFMDLATVALDAGPRSVVVAQWLLDVGEARTLRPRLALHVDPLTSLAETGSGTIAAGIDAGAALAARDLAASVFLASGRAVHEAGGGEAAELGFMLSCALAYARAMIDRRRTPADAFKAIALGLSADGDYFLTLAKHRAARALWARATQAAVGAPLTATIETRSSRRMLAALDPWVNMLRLTSACFGAATGGADAIVLDAFSQPLGRPTAFARRQARNTQLVLMEESHLGRVADPAAGSWHLESLSRDLAERGWAFMQRIEAAGGAAAALESGFLAEAVAKTRDARAADIARRKAGLIGVSEFPDLAEAGVDLDPIDPRPFARPTPPAPAGKQTFCPPLTLWRAAEPFEALRRRADALDPRPRVFIATLGAPADYSGRVGFARNLFAAGGFAAELGEASDYDAAGAALAVICSSDALYAESGEEAARTLKHRGARHVYLAGRPGELEDRLAKAGVDSFLYSGLDAPETLARALEIVERR